MENISDYFEEIQGRVFTTTLTVRSYEVDFYQHLNHAVYVNYFEYARERSLQEIGYHFQQLKENDQLFVVVEMNLRYLKPALMGETLQIYSSYGKPGRTSFRAEQVIVRDQDVLTRAMIRFVQVNHQGKPTELDPEFLNHFR